MGYVEFTDNRIKVEAALDDAVLAYLEESAGEIESQAKRNMDNLSGHWYSQQKGEWTHYVDEDKREATVGNPMEAMLWTEYGTGEYSISPKGGRHGYWIYVKDGTSSPPTNYVYKGGKQYTLAEAKKIVAILRNRKENPLDAHYTRGQRPHRILQHAFDKTKGKIIRRLGSILNQTFSE